MTESKFKIASSVISEKIILSTPNYDRLDIFDQIEKYESVENEFFGEANYPKIARLVKRKLNTYIKYRESKKSICKFEFSKTDEFSLVSIVKRDKRFNAYTDFYYKLISLDNLLFEKFSAKYVELLMCDFSIVSRASADGGIDFMGKGNFQKLLNLKGEELKLKSKEFLFRVIGQSKRYSKKNKIGTKEIREFLGSVKILQEALNPGKVSAWLGETSVLNEIRLADPFLYLFITTSYFSADSILLSDKLGIYTIDIDDIIFDLITHDIGMKNNEFNAMKFENWINKN